MNKKEIKKQIVEALLEDKELISSLLEIIENDKELKEYYSDMKSLLSEKDDSEYDPGDAYFESTWEKIQSQVALNSKIIPFYKTSWFRNVAAIIIIAMSFYLGTLQQETQIDTSKPVLVKNEKLKSLFRKYNVTFTSFVNMDEYESHDLLKLIIRSSKNLLDETRELKKTYKSNDDVHQILSELERILFAITILQDQNASKVQIMQYRLQSEIGIDADFKKQI